MQTKNDPKPLHIQVTDSPTVTTAGIAAIDDYDVAEEYARGLTALAVYATAHADYLRAVKYQQPDGESRMLVSNRIAPLATLVDDARLAAPDAVSVALATERVAERQRQADADRVAREERHRQREIDLEKIRRGEIPTTSR